MVYRFFGLAHVRGENNECGKDQACGNICMGLFSDVIISSFLVVYNTKVICSIPFCGAENLMQGDGWPTPFALSLI